MGVSICFVPNCKTGSAPTRKASKVAGIKVCSLFTPPKDPDHLIKWRRAIPRKDKVLCPKDAVCELHFQEEVIERFFITRMPDGSEHKLKRGKPRLKPEAVPTIFPNLPKYLTTLKKTRKAPTERPFIEAPKKRRTLHQKEESDNCEINELDNSELSDLPSWLKDMKIVKVPSSSWSTSMVGSVNGIWTCYNKDFMISKRVVVCKDLSVKIFCVEREVSIEGIARPESAEDVSVILAKVDSLPICAGVKGNIRSEQCAGYFDSLQSKSSGGTCLSCKESLRQKSKERKGEVRRNLLYAQTQNEAKKVMRLKKKVIKMKSQIQALHAQCSQAKQERIEEHLKDLPENQQLAIKACFLAAQVPGKKNIHYSLSWLYECLLLREKSRKIYEHLQKHQILALPSINAINRYVINVKADYDLHLISADSCLESVISST